MNLERNCLRCSNYFACKDNAKSIIYTCGQFKLMKASNKQEVALMEDFLGLPLATSSPKDSPIIVPTQTLDVDVKKIINQVINEKRIVSPDIKFPEGDFLEAPNFYTWCVSDKFLNQKPFVEQAIIGTRLFAEYCPDCTDMEWFLHTHKVNDSLLKFERKVALLEHGRCPHCGKDRLYFFKKKKLHAYVELALSAGQRSGKSAVTAMLTTYITHRVLKLERPNEVYGLLKSTVLQGTFTALTFAQAKDTLWDPFYGNILESPWFQQYHAAMDEVGSRYGEELYNLKDTFVVYKHRRVSVYPAGPDKRVLRGRTRIFGCLDGNTLVSTSKGLLPIKNDLSNTSTHVGDKHFGISNWVYTGIKPAFKVKLENGLYLKLTANHELKTDKGWVRTDCLTKGDLIKVSLGGDFPKTLLLNYTGSYEPIYASIYRHIEKVGRFEIPDLEQFGRSVTPITSSLRRNGYIKRTYYKGRNGSDGLPRCYFETTSKFDAERMIAESAEAQSYTRRTCVFPEKMTKELASLLGYYVADGSYSKSAVEFYFASSIPERLKHFKKCFKSVFGVNPNVTQYETDEGTLMTRYAVGQKVMKDFLRYVGLKPATSRKKEIPWSILQAPKECAAAFLSALFDCDGGVDNTYIWYLTKSFKLGSQVQLLLQRFGVLSDFKSENDLKSVKIRERIYQDTFLDSIGFSTVKVDLPEKSDYRIRHAYKGIVHIPVKSIKGIGKRKVYDITVDDEDHGFTANGIVAHNSIDELGWFPNDIASLKNIKMNATEVYIALERSLLTVRAASRNVIKRGFYNVPMGYFINISSPSSVRDKIMELVRKSQHSTKILGLCKPTWEMNPHVPKSALAEEFKKDPVAAMRDYGAQPPLTNNAFLPNKDAIIATLKGKKNALKMHYKMYKTSDGSVEVYGDLEEIKIIARPCILSLDAGYSNNSFAFALGFLGKDDKPVVSVIGEVIPTQGMRINHSLMYTHLLDKLFENCNIVKVVADRWNSLKVLADMEVKHNVERQIYSLKYTDMQMFKSYIEDNEIKMPACATPVDDILKYDHSEYPACFKNKPVEHFVLQLLTIQDTGTQVIKGDQLTDDIARAVMLLVQQLIDEDNQELLKLPDKQIASQVDATQMAVYRNYSGGGSSKVGGMSGSNQGSSLGMTRQRSNT